MYKMEVTLTSEDIIKIVTHMCERKDSLKINVDVGRLEYVLFDAIKNIKQVDFFNEEN